MGTNNKGITYLSYLGILALIPFMTEKDDEFVQFHAKQGLNLFIFEIIGAVVLNILSFVTFIDITNPVSWFLSIAISFISWIVYLLFLIVSIIGMINVSKGLKTPLPVIGSIQIIK